MTLDDFPRAGSERVLLTALRRAYPEAIPMSDLVYELYGCREGPNRPELVIRQHMKRLRRELPRYGWTIPTNRGGRPGRYRLEPLR